MPEPGVWLLRSILPSLKFVYLGNVGPHKTANTVCYNCQNLIVRRDGFHADVLGLNGSRCKFCGAELNFRV